MAMLIRSDNYCTAATMSIVTLRNILCFASLRRPCKYIDICYDVKYAFISFYISIMFYSFNYYRCTICIMPVFYVFTCTLYCILFSGYGGFNK